MGYGFGAFGRSWGYGGLPAAPARAFSPADLFAGGEQGLWYRAGDLSAAFQTNLGTTPVAADGDTVGLALDQHAMGGKAPAAFIAAQPDLRALGAPQLQGAAPPATYDAATGAGTVARVDSTANGYVRFDGLAPNTAHFLDIEVLSGGISIRSGDVVNPPTVTLNTIGARSQVRAWSSGGGSITLSAQPVNGTSASFILRALKALPGNHATQPTSSLRPKFRAGGHWQFDGTDDALATDAACGAGGNTLAVKLKAPPTLGSDKVIAGVMGGGTGRFYLGLLAGGGEIAGAVGPATPSVIKGGGSVLGTDGVAILTADGATVTLYWNGAPIYQAAQAGAPSTSAKIGIGRLSDLSGYYFPGGIFEALFVQRALDPATALALTDFWRN